MSTAKHTPGPWQVKLAFGEVCITARGALICSVPAHELTVTAHLPADVRLIAAAPELLEALEMLEANVAYWIEQSGHDPADDGRVKLARAAIAKATGAQP